MYDYVRPGRMLQALQWLKEHNPLYKDIVINKSWTLDAANDSNELWSAFSGCSTHVITGNGKTATESSKYIIITIKGYLYTMPHNRILLSS